MSQNNTKIAIIEEDSWLKPYTEKIQNRMIHYSDTKKNIELKFGNLSKFSDSYKYLGFNYDVKLKGWWYREWAPAAHALFLIGDFNNWDRQKNPLNKNSLDIWELFLPDTEYSQKFKHQSLVKVHIQGKNGDYDRIPAYIQRMIQDLDSSNFSGQLWAPENPFKWSNSSFDTNTYTKSPLIYEAHIGMAQEDEIIGTYVEFADKVIPRIKKLGYNTLQLMAIAEHPYYGSFGYHVSNYFAPSSRFGTPEDLKYLIDKAHSVGICVIMDIVHSHSIKNLAEGLFQFDGSDAQYFLPGDAGYHQLWDSYLFDYNKIEVLQFLLSNLKYWIEEFHFDGFRFDGVTSMLYQHHGNSVDFDHYDKFYGTDTNEAAIIYLTLANELVHNLNKQAITIAEDMSGMPGICRKPVEGGLGFDYRLGMGIPDYWIKILKERKDEDWNIYEIFNVLSNRRWKEKTISYCESHDQALVGDKTIAFWLMDQEMYWHMHEEDKDLIIERGIALHKLIRLITISLGGEGYMNFIGNEFGHPEWIDFPREGNNWSCKYARRQWSLVDNERLKYKFLNNFDKQMLHVVSKYDLLNSPSGKELNMDGDNKIIIFERKNLIFVFNFSTNHSIFDYKFKVNQRGAYKIILNSDSNEFGGQGRIDINMQYITQLSGDDNILSLYLTNRTALVLELKKV